MILKYQSGRKHELTNDMVKRAKGEGIRDTANLNQMILRAKYEHMIRFWTDRLPADSAGLEAWKGATQDYEMF